MTVPTVTEVWRPQPAHSVVHGLRFQRPAAFAAARRTDETLGPTLLCEIRRAGGFVRKLALEFEQGSRKRAHDRAPEMTFVHSMFYAIPGHLSPHHVAPDSKG